MTQSILEKAFPIAPTSLSLISMDETDLAQLRQRIAVVRRVRDSLEGDLRLVSSDGGDHALWFLQKASSAMNTGGIDLRQDGRSMHVHHPAQNGVRTFRLEADVSIPRFGLDEDGANAVIDMVLAVYDAILELPHGGQDGTPDEVATAAERAASIVSALHAADGRDHPGALSYAPRTPWRTASIVRHRSAGGGSLLKASVSSVVLADEPVCVSIRKADDWYHVKGAPGRHVVAGSLPDPVAALRILASIDATTDASNALVPRRGDRT